MIVSHSTAFLSQKDIGPSVAEVVMVLNLANTVSLVNTKRVSDGAVLSPAFVDTACREFNTGPWLS